MIFVYLIKELFGFFYLHFFFISKGVSFLTCFEAFDMIFNLAYVMMQNIFAKKLVQVKSRNVDSK
jgi:hypothetical protein